ncbi:MAG: 1-(5-phosphoribosyl)-5-amino-4-imidazole-carboxylate carboxylase, partial [Planctomycetota bacterium]
MTPDELREKRTDLAAGGGDVDRLFGELSGAVAGGDGVSRTVDAAVDIDRRRRCGFPEAVFG